MLLCLLGARLRGPVLREVLTAYYPDEARKAVRKHSKNPLKRVCSWKKNHLPARYFKKNQKY